MSKVEERGETGSVAAQEITLLPDFSLPPVFFPPLSATLHTLSNLQWASSPPAAAAAAVSDALLCLLSDCHQHLAPGPGFTPSICMQQSMLASTHIHTRTHAHTHTSAPQPFTHTHKPIASEPLFQRDNWSEREEREHQWTDLSASLCPNYPISPLRVSHRKCTEGSRRQSLHVWKKANPL